MRLAPAPCTCVRAVRRGLDGPGVNWLEGCGGVGLFWIEQSCAAGGEAGGGIYILPPSFCPSPLFFLPPFSLLYISLPVILHPSLPPCLPVCAIL